MYRKFDLKEVAFLVDAASFQTCDDCYKPIDFEEEEISGYETKNGWKVDGDRYQLYVSCSNCGNQVSFGALGISKN